MPIIVKRPKALSELAQIWDYIADDSEERADAFIATIDARFQTLSQHPAMGRRREELAPGYAVSRWGGMTWPHRSAVCPIARRSTPRHRPNAWVRYWHVQAGYRAPSA